MAGRRSAVVAAGLLVAACALFVPDRIASGFLDGNARSQLVGAGLSTAGDAEVGSGDAEVGSLPGGGVPSTATPFEGFAFLGALFPHGSGSPHTCTGSVVREPSRSVVLTAAHCVSGDGRGLRFVPGYRDGTAPYGEWTVTAVYADPRWTASQDPHHDYAFLVVAPRADALGHPQRLGDVVDGREIGAAPDGATPVRLLAYPAGIDDRPVTCTRAARREDEYPALDCHGYASGTSGGPWLASAGDRSVIRGVIGGLHQGGCLESTSYSAPFGPATLAALGRATQAAAPDVLPVPGGDGCPPS